MAGLVVSGAGDELTLQVIVGQPATTGFSVAAIQKFPYSRGHTALFQTEAEPDAVILLEIGV